MKNRFFLFVVALFSTIGRIVAQDVPIRVNNQLYNLNFGDVPSFCISMTDTTDILIDSVWAKENDVKNQSWELRGDMSFAPGYSSSSYPLTRIVSSSDGYAKGRITYKYKTTGCSSAVSIDLYKMFAPPAKLEIKGPECIVDSQEVVYSVDPILTKNLDDQIGIDTYTWNIIENPNLPFVDTILYVSGDGSSVTFRAKNVNPQSPPVLSVSVGRCNGWSISKQLGNATPKPDLLDTLFVPVGIPSFNVGVRNPKQNIDYTWECKPASSFGIEQYGAYGDSALVTIKSDASKAECRIIVSATYRDIQCNISADTMYVVRTWGERVEIRDSTKVADSCYTVKTEEDTPYMFTVEGSSSIPTETECDWILPYGWNFKGGHKTTGTTIEIYPTAAARLVDTLILKPLDARDHAKPDSFPVHVKPAPVPVNRIMQNGCLQYNEAGMVYIDTTGMNMPEGVWFEWSAPYAEILNTQGTDTLRFIPSTQTNIVSVTAKGINSCDAASTEHNLIFEPQKPDSIICEGCECISVNMPDTLKFYVANGQSTQTYSWSYTSNLSAYRTNNDTIELITDGAPNAKDTVWVKAVQNNQDCPESDTIRQIISVTQPIVSIEYDGEDGSVKQKPSRPTGVSDRQWYLLYNGSVVQNGLDDDTGISNMLSEDFWNTIGDIDQFTGYTIVLEYTLNNCQRIRITYGTSIVSNFMPTDTITISELPQSAQNQIRKKRITLDKRHELMLYPNPATNLLNIHMEDEAPFDVHIINTEGEKVYMSANLSHYAIDVSFLPIGTYIVMATRNGKRLATKKLIRD